MMHKASNEEMGAAERAKIESLIRAHGEPKAAKALGVDKTTALRAALGMPIQRRTAEHLRRVLAEPIVVDPAQLALLAV